MITKASFVILITYSLLSVNSYSQGIIDSRIVNEINHLKIDTLIIYSFYCVGCSTSDTCKKEESHYLIWEKYGRYYLKKFDYCHNYKKIELEKTPLTFYIQYKKVIDEEQIRPPTYQRIKRVEGKLDTAMETTSIDHSYYHKLLMQSKNDTTRKTVDIFDLNTIKSDDGLKNIYYDYNRRTKTKILIDNITSLIKRLTIDKKFILE